MPDPFRTLANAMDGKTKPEPKPATKPAAKPITNAMAAPDRTKDPEFMAAVEASKKRQKEYEKSLKKGK